MTVPPDKIDELAKTEANQGIVAVCAEVSYVTVADILNRAKEKQEPPFVIIADEITDPHNLGAIIRTANCTGAHGVIIPKNRSAGVTPVVFKTSAGAAARAHCPGGELNPGHKRTERKRALDYRGRHGG